MIFGFIKTDKNTTYPQKELQNILNLLSWEQSVCTSFSEGSFHGIYAKDKRLPNKDATEVFFREEKDDILVLIDGTIYNQQEITDQLVPQQKLPATPELICLAFQKWGISFAEKLNGDFALCIHLEREKRTLFFSDHLGVRPLAISVVESNVFFATDVMGLCKALFDNKKIEKEFLVNFFMTKIPDYNILPHKNIIKVKPGYYLEVASGEKEHKPYWFPEKIQLDNHLTQSRILKDLNQLITDAVTIRCDSRFTASAHVSGGLDSGIVAVLARKVYAEQALFYGFSWSPEKEKLSEIKFDERVLVKKICQENGIMPLYVDFDAADYLAYLSNWRYPSEFIYEKKTIKLAHEKKINLIFSGWGGDEFISIGNYGIDSDLFKNLDWVYFMKKYPPGKFKKFIYALYSKALFPLIRNSGSKYKTDPSIYPYLKNTVGINLKLNKEKNVIETRREFHLHFLKRNHLSARTSDWYVHGQRNGIEYRYPLLDKRIVEYMFKVPSRCLVMGKKNRIILREIGKGLLPDEVLSNTSKDDPVCSYRYDQIVRSMEKQILEEYLNFKNNPDLDFIDFELLDNRMHELQENISDEKDNSKTFIFYYLKLAHEFTKGYYENLIQ